MVANGKLGLGVCGGRIWRAHSYFEAFSRHRHPAFVGRIAASGAAHLASSLLRHNYRCSHQSKQQGCTPAFAQRVDRHLRLNLAANCARRLGQHQLRCAGLRHLPRLPKKLVA